MSFLSRFAAVFLLLVLAPLARAQVTAPTIATPTATVGANGAVTLSAQITTNGGTTTVTFNYGLTTTYTDTRTTSLANAVAAQTASVALTGLVGGQTYNFQVAASNSAGTATPTTNQTFAVPAYAGRPTTGTATTKGTPAASTATLRGTVTANGTPGKVFFQYGLTTAYGTDTAPQTVAAGDIAKAFSASAPNLTRNTLYHYRMVFVDDATLTAVNGANSQFTTNNAPTARPDTVSAAGAGPTTINVLSNDRDPDGDALTLDAITTQAQNGRAAIVGNTIVYTPAGAVPAGFDTFTYRVRDAFAATATATVSIRAIRAAFAGTHGGFIQRINGKEAGYFTVTATANGSFTGIAMIEGKRYTVTGTITPEGVFRGWAINGGESLPVILITDQGETSSTVTALFGNGQWSSELSIDPDERATRGDLTGRYTVGLAAGGNGATTTGGTTTTSTSVSNNDGLDGTGWVAVRVREDGTAALKGRLPDGRSFATRGTLDLVDGVPTLRFYDDPEDTRLVGALTLGDSVGGTVRTDRDSSGEGRFPRGFDLQQAASGARYREPADGKRVLDTTSGKGQTLTLALSGGGLSGSLSRTLFLDDRDKVTVLEPGGEDLSVRIDRKSGRFQTKFTVDEGGESKRLKATGVLIQAATTTDATTGTTSTSGSGRGVGIFSTSAGTGSVTISGGAAPSTPPPTTTPPPTDTPTDPTPVTNP